MKTCNFVKSVAASFMAIGALAIGMGANMAKAAPIVTTIDFEALAGNNIDPTAYLAGFGITASTEAGTKLTVVNEAVTYGGGVVDAPSGTQYLTQVGDGTTADGSLPPNTFTLFFAALLDSFGFSDSAILLPSINSPWMATAYDVGNSILDSVSYSPPPTHPTVSFTLNGPAIHHVTFNQTATSNAAFYAANLDDIVLTTSVPEPGALALFGLGLAGLGFARRRKTA